MRRLIFRSVAMFVGRKAYAAYQRRGRASAAPAPTRTRSRTRVGRRR